MKILVPIKRVPDPYGRIKLTPDGLIDEGDIKWVINPFDEIALEEAVRMREQGTDCEIIVVCIGESVCEEQIRTALAMGADRGIFLEINGELDPGMVSFLLAEIYKSIQPDLVLMGKQGIDDDHSQTGQWLAARLNIPQATFASSIEILNGGQSARVIREVDSGRETVEIELPAVITTDLRLNEPRYVALPAIIKARSKPISRMTANDFGPVPSPQISVIKRAAPTGRNGGRIVGSVDELITALRDESKVLH